MFLKHFTKELTLMKFGYARVSKNDQHLEIQLHKLKEAGCEEIFSEKISGAKDNRPQLNELLSRLRKGDIVYVVRLDRLGRRMLKLVELINEFKTRGIEFVALENNLDTTTTFGMLLFNICAAFSEMERELIRERVRAGLDSALENGVRGGRPKSITPDKENVLKALYTAGNMSVKQICTTVGISRSVYYRAIESFTKS